MEFNKLISERYSVRSFRPEHLPEEVIDKILEAGHMAPTGCNYQPQRILVLNTDASIKKLRTCTRSHFNAPCAMLVCHDRTESWKRPYDGALSSPIDAVIVATHMMLAAHNAGVGCCWVMHFNPFAMRETFNIPENVEPVALLVMGYTLWSYNAIEFAAEKGYLYGYISGNFGPTDNITRQDFVVILARIAKVNLNSYSGRTSFPDVAAGSYYEAAVKWASINGIVTGYNNGKFGVGDKITREQMVTIFYRYAQKLGYDTSVPSNAAAKLYTYGDAGKVNGYAKSAMIWALNKGIISGMSATNVGPQEYASRGQTATILMNISKKGIMPI